MERHPRIHDYRRPLEEARDETSFLGESSENLDIRLSSLSALSLLQLLLLLLQWLLLLQLLSLLHSSTMTSTTATAPGAEAMDPAEELANERERLAGELFSLTNWKPREMSMDCVRFFFPPAAPLGGEMTLETNF